MEQLKGLFDENVINLINFYLWRLRIRDINKEYNETWKLVINTHGTFQFECLEMIERHFFRINARSLFLLKNSNIDDYQLRQEMNLISNFTKKRNEQYLNSHKAYGKVTNYYVPENYYYTSGINLRYLQTLPGRANEGYVKGFME
tara:strand:+ start:9573 stop:10007 length:435 start_codon:yes stop_codon:yes gene_type:complete